MISRSERTLSVAILTESNGGLGCRANRVAQALKEHKVTIIARNPSPEQACMQGFEVLGYEAPKKRNFWQEARLYLDVFWRRYERLIKIPTRLKAVEYLKERQFDVIFCDDLVLLPLALENKKEAKVIFDAREFYPMQMEGNFRWRLLFSGFNDWMCKKYLDKPDLCYTVSPGLAKAYENHYGRKFEVLMSCPDKKDIKPSCVSADHIKLVHQGGASRNRKLENMIYMMDYVDSRFTLDLLLCGGDADYAAWLKELASARANVRVPDPIPYESLIEGLADYDIGINFMPPTTMNFQYALPNKLFEAIQARLALAVGPLEEMSRFVQKERIGIVSDDFEPKNIAQCLNRLTKEEIARFKGQSHKAAEVYYADRNAMVIREFVKRVLGQESRL